MSTVPETTLKQLGGPGRLSVMIGAHSFTQNDNTLSFKFKARAKNGSNCILVTLEPSDTYKVKFVSIRGASFKLKGEFEDIYADNLRSLIEQETGLALSL